MKGAFLDTVGLVAVWDEDDQWHSAASAALLRLLQSGSELLTTTFVLLECGNAAARRPFRPALEELRNDLETTNRLIWPTESDWREAWHAFERHEGNNAGIVDCVSFVVMRRLGIKQVFSNDEHFRAAGFETLF